MIFRLAVQSDVPAVAGIYEEIHDGEELGRSTIGWIRGVYPTEQTAQAALGRGDLFVLDEDGTVVGAAIINRQQVDVYEGAGWAEDAPADEVMVLHTLVISPRCAGRRLGAAFVRFYEEYALSHGCRYLRMDTNARNQRARELYARLGYAEADIVPCAFNGIPGVRLVLLEKTLA